MQPWNFDMEAAPRGKTVTVTRAIKGEPRQVEEYVRNDVILASKCGKVTKSYWIPDENRWAGFQPGEEVRAWLEWPTHPDHHPDASAISAVKGSARLENAVGVETLASGHLHLEDVGSGA